MKAAGHQDVTSRGGHCRDKIAFCPAFTPPSFIYHFLCWAALLIFPRRRRPARPAAGSLFWSRFSARPLCFCLVFSTEGTLRVFETILTGLAADSPSTSSHPGGNHLPNRVNSSFMFCMTSNVRCDRTIAEQQASLVPTRSCNCARALYFFLLHLMFWFIWIPPRCPERRPFPPVRGFCLAAPDGAINRDWLPTLISSIPQSAVTKQSNAAGWLPGTRPGSPRSI